MEARAPTPSLTPYIIDYARLQISLEKEKKTQRDKAGERAGARERKRERGGDVEASPETILSSLRYSRF